jgi:hypothetical protein
MSDSLSKGFYNGKANPFELHQFKLVTSVKELERSFPGPKVHMFINMYVCMYLCIYIYVYVHIDVCIY